MFHNEKSTSVVPSNGTATTKSVVSTPRLDKPVTMQEVQDACKMWNLPMILSLKEAAEVIKIQPSTLKRKVSEGYFKGCVSRGKPLRFWSLRLILSRGASKPATKGRNSGVQNQPLIFCLITSNNLSCQGHFWTHIRLMFGTDRRSSGVRLHLALRYRCCHA